MQGSRWQENTCTLNLSEKDACFHCVRKAQVATDILPRASAKLDCNAPTGDQMCLRNVLLFGRPVGNMCAIGHKCYSLVHEASHVVIKTAPLPEIAAE